MIVRTLRVVPLLLFGAACAPEPEPEPEPAVDADGDGLDSVYESRVGTSDAATDSDADGCSDTVEVLGSFDPLDPDDRPYAGGYPRGPQPPASTFEALAAESGEGFEVGKLNPDWTLVDQFGETVQLRDFYGQVVVVELASEWCGPCNDSAPRLDAFYQDNKDKGFVVLQLILEGVGNNSEPDAERWIEATGVSYAVLEDYSPGDYTQTEVAQYYLDVPGLEYDIPNFSLLDRQQRMSRLYQLGDLSEDIAEDIAIFEQALEEPVPDVEVDLPDNAEALRAELGMEEGWITPASLCGGGE